mmetsp:Transcript_3159/g.12074  ORF Transcript_3159/g.12074 Transcript_3159/m.12074 type:complete len:160 (+) Transcript_3159:49-528(+)
MARSTTRRPARGVVGLFVCATTLLACLARGFHVAAPPSVLAPHRPAPATTVMMVKRPQLKAAKKANRRRPKKHRLSDIHRTPPPYNVEPQYCDERPPTEYTVLEEGSDDFDKKAHIAAALERLANEEPYDNTDPELEAEIIASIKYPDPAKAAAAMAKL